MRSHVDPCVFISYIQIGGEHFTSELRDELALFEFEQGKSPSTLLNKLSKRSKQTLFHETYHYWQGLRLPFIYRYALLAFNAVVNTFRDTAHNIINGTVGTIDASALERLSIKYKIGRAPTGALFFSGSEECFNNEVIETINISALNLLECATSLAEYQITSTHPLLDIASLKRWEKRNPASLDAFWFIARFLGSDVVALRLALPLINASFHTSFPERAFVELLAKAWYFVNKSAHSQGFLLQDEPCRWTELFRLWVDELPFTDEEDANADILTTSFHKLNLSTWVYGGIGDKSNSLNHPFLADKARAWMELEASESALSWLLDQPGWADGNLLVAAQMGFDPVLSIYKFTFPDGTTRTFLTGISKAQNFSTLNLSTPSEWRGFIADFLTMYGVVRRFGNVHIEEYSRTCGHRACPHYELNLCNAYPIITGDHEKCGFPKRLIRIAKEWRR